MSILPTAGRNEGKQFPRYPYAFGSHSRVNMAGVLPSLITIAELAITLCEYDGTVIKDGGLRSQEAANANAAAGTGIANSRHIRQADGWGHAIDLIALTPGPPAHIDWNNLAAFKAMARAVKIAAALLLTPVRQGCDWNMNGVPGEVKEWDWPHFEDPIGGTLYRRAESEMHRFRAELFQDGWSLEVPGKWAP